MSKSNYRAILAILIALCLLLFVNIICTLTAEERPTYQLPDYILLALAFMAIIGFGVMCYIFGTWKERNRKRQRIDDVTYMLEPHGYRYMRRR